ncbi:hypothetical protein ABER68_04255 [Paenibacillus alvei]
MENHLYFSRLIEGATDGSDGTLGDLSFFIKKELDYSHVDKEIFEVFPITLFGNEEDRLNIGGSKDLIEQFKTIDAKKIDFLETLENVNFVGFSDDNEIILSFKGKDGSELTGTGIYDFTSHFLDSLFDLYKYAKFCLKNNNKDILRENIDHLFKQFKGIQRQYRLIEKNDTMYIRSLTTNLYKNYDNHIATYLTLLFFSKYTKETGKKYYVKSSLISDSELRVFLEQVEPIKIENFGYVYFGALVSNSEIREKTFSIELRYRVTDFKGENTFAGVPQLKDSILNVQHKAKVLTLQNKLNGLHEIESKQNEMIEFILKIGDIKKFTDNELFLLFNKITSNKVLKASTKNSFKELYDNNVINNALTIIEVFNKTSAIATDIDEKITLERVYHQVILEITKNK